MSIKNKTIDRNGQGRIARKYTGHGCHSHGRTTPCWWTHQTSIKPGRRRSKTLCRALVSEKIHPEEVVFPLGNHKPHWYYW